MVFLTVILVGIEKSMREQVPGHHLTRRDISRLSGKVRVYGDDIIVPVEFALAVHDELENFGFRVNVDKSFWTGKFRESCGKEYYDGHDITIIRQRRVLPTRRRDAQEIISAVSLRNQLFKKGLHGTVEYLDQLISDLIPFPAVLETSPVLGRLSYSGFETQRTDVRTQSPLVKGMVVSAVIPKNKLDDYGALLKFFTMRGFKEPLQSGHLERSGRPRSVSITTRWSSPY
jgi:hypothetical protein